MNLINDLVRSVIDKNSLEECSADELQQLAQQYPYFGPVQFLLARKFKEESSPLYEQQSQRAILYFQDQLWFDYLSGHEDVINMIAVQKQAEVTIPAQPTVIIPENIIQEDIPEKIHEPVVEEQTGLVYQTPVTEEVVTTETLVETIITEEQEPLAESPVEEQPEPVYEAPEEEQAIITEEEPVAESAITEQPVTEEEISIPSSDIQTQPAEQEPIAPLTGEEMIPAEQPTTAKEKDILIKFPAFKIGVMDKAAPLTFEPYHTVDYFASLGIRFREEEKPKDRFGQQLKSFTEWLKAMRKLPEAEVATTLPDDKKVTQMAEHSIINRDVVTEAMAEVWEKQGNNQKAIEIYHKLSLLNPAKSSYFAAKIDHLKNL